MGGVRTDAISGRDLEVLELIARLGVAPRSVVAEWSGNGDRSGNYRRERRLLDAQCVAACPPFAESGPVVRITRRGLRACGREELWEPRYSESRVKHALDVGRVGGPALSAATRGRTSVSCIYLQGSWAACPITLPAPPASEFCAG